jgi:hypothetical protein
MHFDIVLDLSGFIIRLDRRVYIESSNYVSDCTALAINPIINKLQTRAVFP